MFVYIALGVDGRAMSMMGSELRINCCTGPPVMGSLSISTIVPRSLSTSLTHTKRDRTNKLYRDED